MQPREPSTHTEQEPAVLVGRGRSLSYPEIRPRKDPQAIPPVQSPALPSPVWFSGWGDEVGSSALTHR